MPPPTASEDRPTGRVWEQPWFWMVPFGILAVAVVVLAGHFGRDATLSGGPDGIGITFASQEPDLTTVLDTLLSEHPRNVYREWTLSQLREDHGLYSVADLRRERRAMLDSLLARAPGGSPDARVLRDLRDIGLFHEPALREDEHADVFVRRIAERFPNRRPGESHVERSRRITAALDSHALVRSLVDRAENRDPPFVDAGTAVRANNLLNGPPPGCAYVHGESEFEGRIIRLYHPGTDYGLRLFAVGGRGITDDPDRPPNVQLNPNQFWYLFRAKGPANAEGLILTTNRDFESVTHDLSPERVKTVGLAEARAACYAVG